MRDEGDGFDYNHLVKAELAARKEDGRSYNDFRSAIPKNSLGYGLFYVIRNNESTKWNKSGNEITIRKKVRKN